MIIEVQRIRMLLYVQCEMFAAFFYFVRNQRHTLVIIAELHETWIIHHRKYLLFRGVYIHDKNAVAICLCNNVHYYNKNKIK